MFRYQIVTTEYYKRVNIYTEANKLPFTQQLEFKPLL